MYHCLYWKKYLKRLVKFLNSYLLFEQSCLNANCSEWQQRKRSVCALPFQTIWLVCRCIWPYVGLVIKSRFFRLISDNHCGRYQMLRWIFRDIVVLSVILRFSPEIVSLSIISLKMLILVSIHFCFFSIYHSIAHLLVSGCPFRSIKVRGLNRSK